MIAFTPAALAAMANSTAPCRLPWSQSATAGNPPARAKSTIAPGDSVEFKNE